MAVSVRGYKNARNDAGNPSLVEMKTLVALVAVAPVIVSDEQVAVFSHISSVRLRQIKRVGFDARRGIGVCNTLVAVIVNVDVCYFGKAASK